MGKPTLYYMDLTMPSRSTMLTIAALGLDVEYKSLNLIEKEQMKPEFLAINPQHTVPTLVDDGKVIWDSHAINAYLVTKYGSDDALYPKEPYQRAVVDQRLHFNNSVLFNRFAALVKPVFLGNATEWSIEAVKDVGEAFDFLEIFLGDNQYVAGNQLTIADFSIVAMVTTLWAYELFFENKFPKIQAWIKRMEQLPYYHEANQQYIEGATQIIRAKMEANKVA